MAVADFGDPTGEMVKVDGYLEYHQGEYHLGAMANMFGQKVDSAFMNAMLNAPPNSPPPQISATEAQLRMEHSRLQMEAMMQRQTVHQEAMLQQWKYERKMREIAKEKELNGFEESRKFSKIVDKVLGRS